MLFGHIFFPAGQYVYNLWHQPSAARLSYAHTTCMAEPAVCLKTVWFIHGHFWVLCNLSTFKVKGKKMQKKKKNNPAHRCWQPADLPSVCTSVACRRAQSPRPVSTDDLLSLVGSNVTPSTGSHEWRRVQSWLGGRSLIKVEVAEGT